MYLVCSLYLYLIICSIPAGIHWYGNMESTLLKSILHMIDRNTFFANSCSKDFGSNFFAGHFFPSLMLRLLIHHSYTSRNCVPKLNGMWQEQRTFKVKPHYIIGLSCIQSFQLLYKCLICANAAVWSVLLIHALFHQGRIEKETGIIFSVPFLINNWKQRPTSTCF